jgi:hypothetical protein
LLPEPLAYLAYLFANLALLWKVSGLRRGFWALLSFPVLFCLFVGQIDLLLGLLVMVGSPWTLGLTIVKPQVAFVVLPWALHHLQPRDLFKAGLVAILFVGISFLLRPTWFAEWRAGSPGMPLFAQHASNLYWLVPASRIDLRVAITILGSILILPIGYLLNARSDSWTTVHLLAPLTNIYSPSILAEWIGPLETALSWVAIIIVGGDVHHGAPLFLVGLSILIRNHYHQIHRPSKSLVKTN